MYSLERCYPSSECGCKRRKARPVVARAPARTKPGYFLNSYRPLNERKRGREIAKNYGLLPYIDHSIRREPDFETEYPTITSLCRASKFAPRLIEKDQIAYVTAKSQGVRRLVALLEVIHIFANHRDAADSYGKKKLPSNCMVSANPPEPIEKADPRGNWKSAKQLDYHYKRRAKQRPQFVVCRVIDNVLWLSNPPELPEDCFGKNVKFPNTRGSAKYLSRSLIASLSSQTARGKRKIIRLAMQREVQDLFHDGELYEFLQAHVSKILQEIDQLNENYILSVSVADLTKHLVEEYTLDPIVLDEENKTADYGETKVNKSHDPMYSMRDWDTPVLVPGMYFEYSIPFSGDVRLFKFRPSRYTLTIPRCAIVGSELRARFATVKNDANEIRSEFESLMKTIRIYLHASQEDVQRQNAQLENLVRTRIETRRAKLLRNRGTAEALGGTSSTKCGTGTELPGSDKKEKTEVPSAESVFRTV